MSRTKITRKGQITIPKEIRDRLSLKESDNLDVKIMDNLIVMERLESFDSLKGSLRIPQKYRKKNWSEIESIAQTEHAREVMDE
jgi:AbrB family looped-hinge helix DNA binding protein